MLYFRGRDRPRLHNIEITNKLIESLDDSYETEKEINKRLSNDKIWSHVAY